MTKIALSALLLLPVATVHAQFSIGTGEVETLYQSYCATCHGQDLSGGLGSSLIDGAWKSGGTNEAIAASIRNGFPDQGMIPYKDALTEQQIRSLVVFIKEKEAMAAVDKSASVATAEEGVFNSELHSFTLEKVGAADGILWGMDFMPDGSIIATQRDGQVWIFKDGERRGPIECTPKVWQNSQGGLLEVKLHPDYTENQWIYLSYSESIGAREGDREAGMTAVVRGRIRDGKWVDEEKLYSAPLETHNSAGAHFGSRFVFEDGYLFFSIGDRGRMEQAQDLSRPNGKVHRIFDDGRVPEDNPFSDTEGALPTIWSYGHRNPQGMAKHPVTGELWAVEHGPRGGDELNLVKPNLNYGWPVITYGINYDGRPITDMTRQEGMEQPVHYWVPSIAVCGMNFYTGERFPEWRNHLFVAGMASEQLHRLEIEDGQVVKEEVVLKGQGRIRQVIEGPDGLIYVSLNDGNPRIGTLYRLVPAN